MAEGRQAAEKEAQDYRQRLAEMARKRSSEAFYALDDPLEAAVLSVLVELLKDSTAATVQPQHSSHSSHSSDSSQEK